MDKYEVDCLIIGGGVAGLASAKFLAQEFNKTYLIEKNNFLGMETSSRNSEVIHAGIYYKPSSLKAQVCVSGSRRLGQWVKERKLPLNECGKLILPQSNEVDEQIEILAARGMRNGAEVEIVSKKKINELMKRDLWLDAETCLEYGLVDEII